MPKMVSVPFTAPAVQHKTTRYRLQEWLPRIVLAPTFLITVIFVYGFIVWTGYLSFSASRMLPSYEFVGLEQYARLWSNPRWYVALKNLAIFSVLYIVLSTAIGLLLAI